MSERRRTRELGWKYFGNSMTPAAYESSDIRGEGVGGQSNKGNGKGKAYTHVIRHDY